MNDLADLYATVGESRPAHALYERVTTEAATDPDLQLIACLSDASVYATALDDNGYLGALARFDKCMLLKPPLNRHHSPYYDFLAFQMDFQRSRYLSQAAQARAESLRKAGKPADASRILLEGQGKALAYILNYQKNLEQNPEAAQHAALLDAMNLSLPNALLSAAQLQLSCAELQAALGDQQAAANSRLKACNTAKRIVRDYPNSKASGSAGRIAVQQLPFTTSSPQELVRQAKDIVAGPVPCDEIATAMGQIGNELSNRALQDKLSSHERIQLHESASQIYESVRIAEKRWLPGKFSENPNYMTATVFLADEKIALESLEEAKALLDEAKGLQLDQVLQRFFGEVTAHYNSEFKKEALIRPSTMPSSSDSTR